MDWHAEALELGYQRVLPWQYVCDVELEERRIKASGEADEKPLRSAPPNTFGEPQDPGRRRLALKTTRHHRDSDPTRVMASSPCPAAPTISASGPGRATAHSPLPSSDAGITRSPRPRPGGRGD